ncbi:MAG: amidohydrolase family protein [Vulcanimicrobiaceae bacterium]
MSAQSLAIRFGVLHHQTGGALAERGVLLIEGERIAAVGGPETPIPESARVLEAAGVVPGLINAHVHLEMSGEPQTTSIFVLHTPTQRTLIAAENARKSLEAGVTTIRDLGGTESIAIELRDAIAAGRVPGPTIVAAGRAICMTGGHGWFISRQADGPSEVRTAVREQRRDGADCIKFIATGGVLTKGAVPGIAQLSQDEMAAGVAEAKMHEMRCAAHAIGAEGIKNALRAGVDSIEHGHLVDDEAIALFLERGTYLVPTLCAIRCIVEAGPSAGMPDFVLRKASEIVEHAETCLRKARAAGVRFAGGSDAGTPYNYHDAYAYEVELMQTMLGLSAREALHAATADGAELLGVPRGRLAAGEVADLLLLDRDIERDLRALREPRGVVKGGLLAYERARG